MNEGPDFQPRADDEADRDPLLGALRQRLGATFGQEPPPELWASIRQQLPTAAPRPWWLRSRQLLVLLLVGVLLSGVAVWLTGPRPAASRLAHRPAAQPVTTSPGVPSPGPVATAPSGATAATDLPVPSARALTQHAPTSQAAAEAPATPETTTGNQEVAATHAPRATTPSSALPILKQAASTLLPASAAKRRAAPALAHRPERALPGAGAAPRHRRRPASQLAGVATASRRPLATSPLAGAVAAQPAGSLPAAASTTSATAGQLAAPVSRPSATTLAATRSARRTPRHAAPPLASHQPASAAATEALAVTRRQVRRTNWQLAGPRGLATPAGSEALSYGADLGPALVPPVALDSLAARRAGLPLVALALPAPLAPRLDSAGPWLPLVRRWSVLALVGPTLSYRTTGQLFTTQQSYAAAPSPTTAAGNLAGATSATTLAGLERPAAGLGAQVQVRRVLTGRWALALGAGYQEYATRLSLQIKPASTSGVSPDSVTASVHQRDTYRFLTLPVQFSYALGPPHGRLSLGLLAGFEPSLYVGGRTTEGSTCSCQQQVFTSASGSPYAALSLGLSLGLEARYRLGGPAARWQWVLQPTGRYVATRFVQAAGLGYVQRQPYSFGLLTGFSWDIR